MFSSLGFGNREVENRLDFSISKFRSIPHFTSFGRFFIGKKSIRAALRPSVLLWKAGSAGLAQMNFRNLVFQNYPVLAAHDAFETPTNLF